MTYVQILKMQHFVVWMYKCETVKELKADMVDDLEKSIEVKPDMLKANLMQRLICSVVRIFAPMM